MLYFHKLIRRIISSLRIISDKIDTIYTLCVLKSFIKALHKKYKTTIYLYVSGSDYCIGGISKKVYKTSSFSKIHYSMSRKLWNKFGISVHIIYDPSVEGKLLYKVGE